MKNFSFGCKLKNKLKKKNFIVREAMLPLYLMTPHQCALIIFSTTIIFFLDSMVSML